MVALYLDESEQFLTRLLALDLHMVPEKERKRGFPVLPLLWRGKPRGLRAPALVEGGKKTAKPSFDAFKTRWPEDIRLKPLFPSSSISEKTTPSFPFPYWIEVQSPHYSYKMRTCGLRDTTSFIDARRYAAPLTKNSRPGTKRRRQWALPIQTPSYFQKLHLFVIDLTSETKSTIPLLFQLEQGARADERAASTLRR